ncbi:MAG: UDP-N-acetylmuramoyl-L-alanyl-D-glutamate--2,6-diaminopimelate ligase [Patescibacteria group bacterium]
MKSLIKKIIPKSLLAPYHKFLAVAAKIYYDNPSEKMAVIGVTGTNGKSTTVILTAKILEEAGHKVGYTSTVGFKVADKEWLNDKKMTMLGRFASQKLLRQMVDAGCQYAVIETSSEGIKQYRHWGINYDVAVFTNLTPEHIESHGGFENYKKAKQAIFAKLQKDKCKNYPDIFNSRLDEASGNQSSESEFVRDKKIPKVIIANVDDDYCDDFISFWSDKKYVFGIGDIESHNYNAQQSSLRLVAANEIRFRPDGVSFSVDEVDFSLNLLGKFNIYNALAAITVAMSQGVPLATCRLALEKIKGIPGRMEFIDEGQNFKVLIDYAPEPEGLKQLYQTIKDHKISDGRIIHVLGSCGGGRDVARRPILGELAASHADLVIITNEDPYDDDPQKIIDQVAEGAIKTGKILEENLFKILDRREAIKKALVLAQAGDLVLLTGKGSEQAICIADGKKIPWDERKVVRELLIK